MYLLIACTMSWLCLIGAFLAAWAALPTPRSTADFAVVIIVGTAAMLFSRLGLVSLLTLLIRLLPSGRLRDMFIGSVLRIVPTLLRSSVLAAVSASLAVHAAQASPLPVDELTAGDRVPSATAAPVDPRLDPGWPTAIPDDPPPDPGWPSTPPGEGSVPSPDHEAAPGEGDATGDDAAGEAAVDEDAADEAATDEDEAADDADDGNERDDAADSSVRDAVDAEAHIVGSGESLWSIAASHPSPGASIQDTVDEIYTANREVIGADPNLIMPGQRLEIQP